jgi:ferredoxin
MTTYQISVDTEACDGIFACLTRDPRFVEDDTGLVAIDPDADPAPPDSSDGERERDGDGHVHHENGRIIANFTDDRIDEARQAAAACPMNAITVDRDEVGDV